MKRVHLCHNLLSQHTASRLFRTMGKRPVSCVPPLDSPSTSFRFCTSGSNSKKEDVSSLSVAERSKLCVEQGIPLVVPEMEKKTEASTKEKPASPPPVAEAGTSPPTEKTETAASNPEEKPTDEESTKKEKKVEEEEKKVNIDEMEFSSGEEKDVFISDLLKEDIYKYINISEVTTPSGVRWIDVKAKPEFLKEKVLSSLSEGHFASTVMRAVGRGGIPESLGAEVISESPLPFTFVDKNYICLLLRTPKNLTTEPKALNANLEQYANVLYKQLHEKKGDKTDWLNEYKRLSGVEDSNGTADGEAEGRPEDYYYDEETNTFCLKRPLQEKGFLSALKRGASFASRRRPKVAPKPMTTPSLSDMTDRLTVFIVKELTRDEDATRPPTDEEKKKYLNEPLFDYSMADKFDEMSFATAEEVKSEATPQETATNKFHSKDGACVINGEKFTVRTKIITVHRRPMPYIEFMTAQWSRMVSGVEEGADDSDDNSNISALAKEMINTWEDILLLVFVGTVQEFQRKGLTGSHMLEYLESAIFEAENNPQRFKELTTQLTQLRLLSRRSSVYEHILKETQVAYIKMKRIAKTNLSLKDKRTLAQLDSVVNLFTHTQEHSETLLYLQLQVAMNEMELHLRTLTVFSTIFIPLDFIVSFLGMNFEHGIMSVVSPNAGYALLIGLLGFVATVTTLWIRRKLSFL